MNRLLRFAVLGALPLWFVISCASLEAFAAGLVVAEAMPGNAELESPPRFVPMPGDSVDRSSPPPDQSQPTTDDKGTARNERGNGMAGHWVANMNCTIGHYIVELFLKHSSPSAFAGRTWGVTTRSGSTVFNGRLKGDQMTFQRPGGDHWRGRLVGPDRLVGSTRGSWWSCTYVANRE